jgi:hypothetical protein
MYKIRMDEMGEEAQKSLMLILDRKDSKSDSSDEQTECIRLCIKGIYLLEEMNDFNWANNVDLLSKSHQLINLFF